MKRHLIAARNTLNELSRLPAAGQLTGNARTQVSQLIRNFNELIAADAEWRQSYTKVESDLNALLGGESSVGPSPAEAGTAGAVATAGVVEVDPGIKAKLIEFRARLNAFEEAARGTVARPNAQGVQPLDTRDR